MFRTGNIGSLYRRIPPDILNTLTQHSGVKLLEWRRRMLSKHSIDRYREIYRKQHGVDISEEEAADKANRLLNVARVVFQPMPMTFEERYKQLLGEQSMEERK